MESIALRPALHSFSRGAVNSGRSPRACGSHVEGFAAMPRTRGRRTITQVSRVRRLSSSRRRGGGTLIPNLERTKVFVLASTRTGEAGPRPAFESALWRKRWTRMWQTDEGGVAVIRFGPRLALRPYRSTATRRGEGIGVEFGAGSKASNGRTRFSGARNARSTVQEIELQRKVFSTRKQGTAYAEDVCCEGRSNKTY